MNITNVKSNKRNKPVPASLSLRSTGQLEPLHVCDRAGVRVSLHFARSPPGGGNPGVAVVVLSAINTSSLPVRDFLFKAAVPKVAKLLPPNTRSLVPNENHDDSFILPEGLL